MKGFYKRTIERISNVVSKPFRQSTIRRDNFTGIRYQELERRAMLSAYFPAYVDGNFTLGQNDQTSPYDLAKTFRLESLPSSDKTIYLDFNGHWSTDNRWGHSIQFPSFDSDGNPGSFSNHELTRIQKIFQNVAEDFLPFDINVTTRTPTASQLTKTSGNDGEYGIRVVITEPTAGFGDGVGGYAKYGSFGESTDTPVFVFSNGITAAAILTSHEVGHSLGLEHDGRPGEEYYWGHGSGATSWGPLMGAPFYQSLTQWSQGEYPGATNQEDDLKIITRPSNGINYRPDDIGDRFDSAKTLTRNGNSVFSSGIIGDRNDVDLFRFQVNGSGEVSLTVNPFLGHGNLDIKAKIFREDGSLVTTRNPAELLNAHFELQLDSGVYFLSVEGTGKAGEYSDYGSLGFFTIQGSIHDRSYNQIGETGRIEDLTHRWQRIRLEQSYVDPVVVVGPASFNGPHSVTIRVRNVTSNSFDVRINEWLYLDGYHTEDSVGYIVLEAGTHVLPNGNKIVASNGLVNHETRRFGFGGHFVNRPVVLSQIVSQNGSQTATTRAFGIDTGGFSMQLQEEEGSDGVHHIEQVSYIAIEQGVSSANGILLDARMTLNEVSDHPFNVQFNADFVDSPVFFAAIQTLNGSNPAVLRYDRLNQNQAQFFLQEEQSVDEEVGHSDERVGYLALDLGPIYVPDNADIHPIELQPGLLEPVDFDLDELNVDLFESRVKNKQSVASPAVFPQIKTGVKIRSWTERGQPVVR